MLGGNTSYALWICKRYVILGWVLYVSPTRSIHGSACRLTAGSHKQSVRTRSDVQSQLLRHTRTTTAVGGQYLSAEVIATTSALCRISWTGMIERAGAVGGAGVERATLKAYVTLKGTW